MVEDSVTAGVTLTGVEISVVGSFTTVVDTAAGELDCDWGFPDFLDFLEVLLLDFVDFV